MDFIFLIDVLTTLARKAKKRKTHNIFIIILDVISLIPI